MTEEEVVALMKSSTSEYEWGANVDKVKAAYDGYPPFWFDAIVRSGVAQETAASYGDIAEIQIFAIKHTGG